MSTIFSKDFKIRFCVGGGRRNTAIWELQADREERCSLCRGELYPGDPYFELEDRAVCEDCLARYARRYIAHRLRRVGRNRKEEV